MIFRLKLEIDSLVQEMVNKIPESLFISDSTTFLDPSIGGGQYVYAIENKLRKYGHNDSNIKKRVFGIEKSSFRLNFAINKHKLVGSYTVDKNDVPSILTDNTMKFDAIVGNPPYQNGNEDNQGSSDKLWMIFVDKSLDSLKSDGYFCVVHPIGWRTVGNKMWNDVYQKKQIIYSRIQPNIPWNVGIKVDWYLLKNCEYTSATEVVFNDGHKMIDFRTVSGIVNSTVVEKMLNYTGEKMQFNQIHTFDSRRSFVSEEKTATNKYPLRHTTPKNIRWSSKKHDWQDRKKVLVSNSGYLYPTFDDGKFGTTQACWALFVDSEKTGKYVIRLINSKLFDYFINQIKTSGYNNKLLNLFPYPKNLPQLFTDKDLYAYFKLTQEEIDTIENYTQN